MDFSGALIVIKDGGLVQRKGWGQHYIGFHDFRLGFCHKGEYLHEYYADHADLFADDWHMVKPVDMGLEPSNSGRALYGDEVVPLHGKPEKT